VTDRSNLYPKLLAEVWPQPRHQLCVFHLLKDINECVLEAVRRPRPRHAAKTSRRQHRRGQPSKSPARARAHSGAIKKDQAYLIWKHRHLLVTRPERLTGRQRHWLSRRLEYVPQLRPLRQFVLAVYRLFDPAAHFPDIVHRWERLLTTTENQADPDLARALAMRTPEKFAMMIAYLDTPLGQRSAPTITWSAPTAACAISRRSVTNGAAGERTIVRFVVLAFDRWRQKQAKATTAEPAPAHGSKHQVSSPHQSRAP
jgi:hypothetical protein